MAKRAIPSSSELWKRHVSMYTTVFSMALAQLANQIRASVDEDKISEELCPILSQVCFMEGQRKNSEIRTPDWEKPIQPISESDLRGGKNKKRPDFTCKYVNSAAANVDQFEIALHIECKILGNPRSNSWIYNRNYTTNGISRFDSITHEYGKRASTGMMIGYIVSMEPRQIIKEVNEYQQKHLPNNPVLAFKLNNHRMLGENQKLNRSNVKPEIFRLIHLWVDLRN